MPKNEKGRHWGCIVYPESAPVDWIDRLRQTGLRIAISPLHDKDIEVDGSEEDKKAHWHVILCWDNGTTTYSIVKSITDKLNAPAPLLLRSVRGTYRYFTHKDNPDKYQYDEHEIQHLGGFDPADYIEWTRSENEAFKREVMRIIRDADLLEYADLLEMLADNEAFDLLSVAMNNTMLYRGYLQSRKGRLYVPPMTEGERREARYNADERQGQLDERQEKTGG